MTLVIPDIVGWAAVIGAAAALIGYLAKVFNFVREPEDIKKEIAVVKEEQESMKKELRVLTNGILACLKGLGEQGCNGPVTAAIKEMEQYLVDTAHK